MNIYHVIYDDMYHMYDVYYHIHKIHIVYVYNTHTMCV